MEKVSLGGWLVIWQSTTSGPAKAASTSAGRRF
jgi:hypothetical protein